MNTTKKQRLDKLVKKLGMTQDLASLLDSDEAYERFEGAVGRVLKSYDGKDPNIVITKENRYGKSLRTGRWRTERTAKSYVNLQRALAIFSDFFGIGRESKDADLIDLEYFEKNKYFKEIIENKQDWIERCGLNEYLRMYNNYARRHRSAKIALRSKDINFVLDLLKQKHKKDIWYECI